MHYGFAAVFVLDLVSLDVMPIGLLLLNTICIQDNVLYIVGEGGWRKVKVLAAKSNYFISLKFVIFLLCVVDEKLRFLLQAYWYSNAL